MGKKLKVFIIFILVLAINVLVSSIIIQKTNNELLILFITFTSLLIELILLAKYFNITNDILFGTKRNIKNPLVISIIVFLLLIFLSLIIFKEDKINQKSYLFYFMIFSLFAIVQSSCEELIFRSYFSYFLGNTNIYLTSIISGVIFGLFHLNQSMNVVIIATIIGTILMLVNKLTNNSYYSYIFHIINNIVGFNIISNGIIIGERPLYIIKNNDLISIFTYLLFFIIVLIVEKKNILKSIN